MLLYLLRGALPSATPGPNGCPEDRRGLSSLHTARCREGGGDGREDGDYDIEDFTPEGVVVEGSHSDCLEFRV